MILALVFLAVIFILPFFRAVEDKDNQSDAIGLGIGFVGIICLLAGPIGWCFLAAWLWSTKGE